MQGVIPWKKQMNGLCDGHINEESECTIVQKMHLAYVFVRLGFRPFI